MKDAPDDLDAVPWSLTVTEHEECAEALREAGVRAVSLRRGWQDEALNEPAVLLVGRAQKIAGDLRKKFGVGATYAAQLPVAYEFPSELLASQRRLRQRAVGRDLAPAEARALWRALVEQDALPCEVAPTNHPDAKPRPKFEPFQSAFELGKRPRRPLVWGAGLPAGGLGMLFGSFKACKSFVAYGLAVAIADGEPFLGFDVAQGTVLVLAGEGGEGIADRIRAATTCARVANAEDELHRRLAIRTQMPNILSDEGWGDLARAIEATDTRPALLIIDTWARLLAAAGVDPLDNAAAMAVVDALKRLQDRFGLAVLVLAHTGHGDGDRAMGAKAVAGACDFIFKVERRDADPLPKVRLDFAGPNLKCKDGREADPLDVDLAEVVVGDRDGKPVTSCRIDLWRPAKAEPKAERKPRAREVLLLLSQEAGPRGITFGAAEAAVGSKSTTSDALAKLTEAGILQRFNDGAGDRWRRT